MSKEKTSIKQATSQAILLLQALGLSGAVIDTRMEGASLTVRRSFTVEGHITVRYDLTVKGPASKLEPKWTPRVETNFPSSIRGGIEMVAFAQLVRELTDAAVQVQLMLDQLEIAES